jgi:zinc finger double-stranded RNA-binding protein
MVRESPIEANASLFDDKHCVSCDRTFQSRKDLDRHLRSKKHNGSIAGGTFKCLEDWCCVRGQKGFSRLDNFKRHVYAVHGDKNLKEWKERYQARVSRDVASSR